MTAPTPAELRGSVHTIRLYPGDRQRPPEAYDIAGTFIGNVDRFSLVRTREGGTCWSDRGTPNRVEAEMEGILVLIWRNDNE